MGNNRIHERPERLNAELKNDKRTGSVYATHGGQRVRVIVERCSEVPRHHVNDRDFLATAEFAGRTYSSYGLLPSHAFERLTRKLVLAIDRYNFEKDQAGDDDLANYEAAA